MYVHCTCITYHLYVGMHASTVLYQTQGQNPNSGLRGNRQEFRKIWRKEGGGGRGGGGGEEEEDSE